MAMLVWRSAVFRGLRGLARPGRRSRREPLRCDESCRTAAARRLRYYIEVGDSANG